MGRIRLAVIGGTLYMLRLAACIERSAPDYVEVLRYSGMDGMPQSGDSAQPDIVLAEQEAAGQKQSAGVLTVVLSRQQPTQETGTPAVFRYQKGQAILRQVFQIYGRQTRGRALYWRSPGNVEMTGVYAPGGHEQQLLFSMAYAAVCSEKKKTLYLNLAEFSGMALFLTDAPEANFSDIIFGLRQRETPALVLQSVLHRLDGLDYVHPPQNPKDIYEMDEADVARLLQLLEEQTDYAYVVWNFGTLNRASEQLMERCERIICLVREHTAGRCRKEDFAQYLQKEEGQTLAQKVCYMSPPAGAGSLARGADLWEQLKSGEYAKQIRACIRRWRGEDGTGNRTAAPADTDEAGFDKGDE